MRRHLTALAALAGALILPTSATAAGAPQIESTWVTAVTATSADLRVEINPGGAPTTYRFQYLTLSAYEANLAAAKDPFAGALSAPPGGEGSVGSGSVPVERTQHIAKLSPSTLYRFRATATNEAGTTKGPVRFLGTEEPTNAFALLDNRGWEMVSPLDKGGGAVGSPEAIFGGGVFQAASNGQSITYSSADSFSEPKGAPPGSQYLSTRSAPGWSTENISTPLQAGGYGDHPDGVPYRFFAGDLSKGLLLDPNRCAVACLTSYSLRQSQSGSVSSTPQLAGLRFEGASGDLSQMVFGSDTGLHRWSGQGALTQISAIPGATLAAPNGAISTDGSRIYFAAEGNLFLAEGATTKPVDEAQGGGGAFQAASADGRYAFFTKASHLYRWDATADTATDLTPSGGVVGVLGISASGDVAYYLTSAGLFQWQEGTLTEVAGAANASDYPPATGTSRVSADGEHLLFLSSAPLAGSESSGLVEAFLWGPPPGGGKATLICVSCNPTGERPAGAASIPGAVKNGSSQLYRPRVLSASGNRVFFESQDALVIQDTNHRKDVYEWESSGEGSCRREGGCVQLISSGRSTTDSVFLDASADGSDAFFATDSSLVPQDPGSFDAYDAREGGGFPVPPNFIACEGDACQPLPEAPEDPTPGTLIANVGNPPPRFATVGKHKKGKHHKGKHHHEKHKGGRK